jgi:ferredoxin
VRCPEADLEALFRSVAALLSYRRQEMEMRVWIDQDLCTGDGMCEQICPQVFQLQSDGLAYVHDAAGIRTSTASERSVAVAADWHDDVLDAIAECPGECIFIEGAAEVAA